MSSLDAQKYIISDASIPSSPQATGTNISDLESQIREVLSSPRFEITNNTLYNKLETIKKIMVKEYCG
jgi:hypothetical protein